MDKSYVSMEQHKCPVCGKDHDTGSLLMDKRLKESMDKYTVTGYGLCPEHQKLFDDDYIALIGVDESKSEGNGGNLKMEDAYRTGSIAHMRKSFWAHAFDGEAPDTPMVFVDEEVINQLQKRVEA